ncbi:Biotin ECF transporter S component BioY [Dermatophilus congolensis]|uniref:Biotin transporter n=1 Tax=Dermatophilus congolensis TaxID=1863 RepID=A0A239VQL2_9MICO|nr:biotin transporter BioY [Dermatophilus congolensis]SNV24571.1 Biotin ECF transporter S component BioY [Dermatophilus congolensis]
MPGSSENVQKFTKVEGRSRGFSARDLSLVASFAALIWVLGVPGAIDPVGSGVPITLQTLGVMLAGAVLGARRGAAASLVVIALCAIGLPVLAGGRGGLGVFVSPTVGFLVGWVPGAAVVGWFASRGPRSLVWQLVGCLVGGVGVIHAVGVPVMAWRAHLSVGQALLADAVFVPGDVVKVVAAVGVAVAVHRAVPELLSVGGGK